MSRRGLATIAERSGARAALPFALATAGAALVSIATVILLTRLLSPEGYGRYAAVLGLVTLAHSAAFYGVSASMLRFHARARDQEGERRLATATRFAFVGAAATAALVWLVAVRWLGSAGVDPALAWAGLALLLLRGWVAVVQAWNRAEGRPWLYFGIEAVQSGGALLLAVAALTLLPGAPAAAVGSAAAASLIAAACAPRLLVMPLRSEGSGALLREILAYGAPLALVFLAGSVLAVSDRLLVAIHAGAAAAGAYAVAFAIADRAMSLLLLPIALATKPLVFAAWEQDGAVAARPLMLRSARWLVLLGFPATTLLIAAPRPIALLLAGSGLAGEAAFVLPWLAVGALLSSFLTHYFTLPFQLARQTPAMIAAIGIPALLNVGANLLLLPRYGVIAAAWTTVAGYALALMLAIALGRRHGAVPFPAGTAAATLALCLPLGLLARALAG
jgi:O-antigen/teichoic acid export membrane protein